MITSGINGASEIDRLSINKSYSKGNVTCDVEKTSISHAYTGGLISGRATIADCYVTDSNIYVRSKNNAYTGSLSGNTATGSSISNSYVANITLDCLGKGTTTDVFARAANTSPNLTPGDNRYFGSVTGIGESSADGALKNALPALELTAEELNQQEKFVGFDFSDTWAIMEGVNGGMPVLIDVGERSAEAWVPNVEIIKDDDTNQLTAKVTVEDYSGGSATLVLALYQGEEFITSTIKEVPLTGSATITTDPIDVSELETYSAKAFVVNNLEKLEPLGNAVFFSKPVTS